jgi:hypothetical protein
VPSVEHTAMLAGQAAASQFGCLQHPLFHLSRPPVLPSSLNFRVAAQAPPALWVVQQHEVDVVSL